MFSLLLKDLISDFIFEQYTRRENIRIWSMPEEIDENLPSKIVSLAREMDIVMQESDINACQKPNEQ